MSRDVVYDVEKTWARERYFEVFCGYKLLQRYVREEFPASEVSDGAIRKWQEEFKAPGKRGSPNPLDKEFRLQDLDEYGLPWESAEYLNDLVHTTKTNMLSYNAIVAGRAQNPSHPMVSQPSFDPLALALDLGLPAPFVSARQVTWWWKIHQTNAGLGQHVTVALGDECYHRQVEHLVLKKPFDITDILDFCFYYNPADQNDDGFQRAVRQGLAKPVVFRARGFYKKPYDDPERRKLDFLFPKWGLNLMDAMRRVAEGNVLPTPK